MTSRRERYRSQPIQQPEMAQNGKKPNVDTGGTWKENLGKYFIDLSKYVATGVVITSIFGDLADKTMIYLSGVVFAVTALIAGLILANKKKGE